jgi:ABC-2 type transport system permease protein
VSADSVIHDIGYQRYDGPRLGRGYVVRSLYTYSMRTAFGIGRGAKAKVFPWLVIGIVLAMAVVSIAVRSITGEVFTTYLDFAQSMSFPVMLFLAAVAPELVSRDLRDGALPLYFSRPVRRVEYPLVKFAALVSAVFLLLGGPQVLLYIGSAFSRDDGLTGAWREFQDLLPGLAAAGIYALSLAGLALLVASLTGRRAFAAAGVVAVFLLTAPIAGIMIGIGGIESTLAKLAFLVNPVMLLERLTDWLFETVESEIPLGDFGPLYLAGAVVLIAGCVGLLLLRYRKVAS